MKIRWLLTLTAAAALTVAAGAQDMGSAPPPDGPGGPPPGERGGMGMKGGGLMGAVTEAAADHFAIKTDAGEVYTVHFDADTRFMKQGAMRGPGGDSNEGGGPSMGGRPQQIKAFEIKAGDMIEIMGDSDATAKTAQARAIIVVAPQRAKAMREMQANYGKTWLMGKVTAVDGTRITLQGTADNAAHSFVADENTSFRKRRDPVTLADIQVGDTVRVEGVVKEGVFVAASVNVGGTMGGMMGGPPPNLPRREQPQQ